MNHNGYNNQIENDVETSERPFERTTPKKPWAKIALLFILAGGILFVAGWLNGSRGGVIVWNNGRLQVVSASNERQDFTQNQHAAQVSAGNFHTLDVSATAMRITIRAADAYQLIIYGDIEPTITTTNGILNICTRVQERASNNNFQFMFNNMSRRAIYVYVPYNVFENIHATNTAGRIQLEGMYAENVILSATSGRVVMEDTHVGTQTSLSAVSGSVNINGGAVSHLDASTTSGTVRIETDVAANSYVNLRTVAGSIRFESSRSFAQEMVSYDVRTTTGSVRVNGDRLSRGAMVQTVTDAQLTINAQTTSGSVRLTF